MYLLCCFQRIEGEVNGEISEKGKRKEDKDVESEMVRNSKESAMTPVQ